MEVVIADVKESLLPISQRQIPDGIFMETTCRKKRGNVPKWCRRNYHNSVFITRIFNSNLSMMFLIILDARCKKYSVRYSIVTS